MNKTTKNVLLGLLAVILLAAGVLLGANWERWFDDKPSGNRLEIDPNAGEYVAPQPSEQTGGEGIAIPGWGSITVPAGKTEVSVDFPNPDANADKYYLSFELRLKGSGEVLYTSGLVPPGQTIQNINLSRPLEAGTYAAVVHVQPYKMDEAQTPTNNADMETQLIVLSG